MLWRERSDRDAGHRWLRDQIQAIVQETRLALPTPACVCPGQQLYSHEEESNSHVDVAVSA